ncbi:MAG: serine/threonine-protein kinase [Sandaracinaceae bacterium]
MTPSPVHLAEAQRRLEAALGFTIAFLVLYQVLYLTVWADHACPEVRALGIVVLVAFVAMFARLRRGPASRELLVGAGLTFHGLLGVQLAFSDTITIPPTDLPQPLITWNCINLLLLPVLVPASARTIVLWAFGLAGLGPIAYGIFSAAGIANDLGPNALASLFVPPFFCAGLAVIPTKVVERLQRDLEKARQLGAYRLVERLGEGGMGEVWRAEHDLLARPAAVKVIRHDLLGEDDASVQRSLARFAREAQVTATLESPHTVGLYDFGLSEGTFYFVMELLHGMDLKRMVEEFGALPPERTVHLLLQACDSLADAHRRGLIHRDVKPANLHVGRRAGRHDVLRVLDFGLVAGDSGGLGSDVEVTQEGTLRGTPAFLAPEAVQGAPVDHRLDLYALGGTAFYLLTERPPFQGETPLQVAVAHVSEPPPAPSAYAETDVTPALDDVVLGLLAKDPRDRPQSADDLAARLRAVEAGFASPWTEEQAAAWWLAHAPELVRPPTASTATAPTPQASGTSTKW